MALGFDMNTVEVPIALIEDTRISIKARLLYALLAVFEDQQPVSNWQFCTIMGVHEQSRRKYMKELVEYGWVKYVGLSNSTGDYILGYETLREPLSVFVPTTRKKYNEHRD